MANQRSDIGLPRGMSRDDAYVQGMSDGEKSLIRLLYAVANDNELDMLDRVLEKADMKEEFEFESLRTNGND
jgi:hypothetical protein